jgi:hypothetical protein
MATKPQTAAAFASRLVASCHNAKTGAGIYQLHGHTIAKWEDSFNHEGEKLITLHWCGWYTPTTASHLNCILSALRAPSRVSYSRARDLGVKGYNLFIKNGECYALEEVGMPAPALNNVVSGIILERKVNGDAIPAGAITFYA